MAVGLGGSKAKGLVVTRRAFVIRILMKYFSFLKRSSPIPVTACNSTRRRAVGFIVLFLISGSASHGIFSQQGTGKKVKPSASATINMQEIEKREAQDARVQGRKKIENDNLIIPPDLPVPKGAQGQTFRPSTSKKKVSHSRKRNQRAGCRKTHRRSV